MDTVINILIALSLLGVVIPLGWGLFAMARGGDYGREWSNRMMSWRVKMQAFAVVMLVLGFWYKATH